MKIKGIFSVIARLMILFYGMACFVFEWRNPTANKLATMREFYSVVTFKKLDKYQPRP